MGSGGAPTGMWETVPEHLEDESPKLDLERLKPRLKVRRPGVPEVEIPIDKREFVIGRLASQVDLVLEDDLVSRRHACLTANERGYFRLEDLGSQNGIKFKGRPVRRLNLLDGDEFSIGKAEFTFHANIKRIPTAPPREPGSRLDSFDETSIPDPAQAVLPDGDAPDGE